MWSSFIGIHKLLMLETRGTDGGRFEFTAQSVVILPARFLMAALEQRRL